MFLLMTASFVIAMSIAITGPPTENELNALQRALGNLAQGAGAGVRGAGEEVCAALPEDMSAALLCPVTHGAEAPRPAPVEARVQPSVAIPVAPPPEARVQDESEPPAEAESALLGSTAGDPPVARRAQPRPRHARATGARPHRRGEPAVAARRDPPRAPLQSAAQGATALAASEEPAFASVRATAPAVLHHPMPSQEEQPAVEAEEEESYAHDAPEWRDAERDDRRWRRLRRWRDHQLEDAEADDREADEPPPDEEWY